MFRMKALQLFLSFAFISIVYSTSSPYQNLTQIQAATPECARKCSAPSISGLTCKPTSIQELAHCICTDPVARRKISVCLQESCSLTDVSLASKPSKAYCAPYPVPSRSREIKVTVIVLLAITIPFMLGRAWVRIVIVRELWWDDYTLALVSVFLIGNFIVNIPMSDLGLGKHVWDVDIGNGDALTKMYYSAQLSYAMVQNVTKISILLCFLRIFPQRWFRIVIYCSLVWVSIRCIIYLCLLGIRCLPLQATWDHSIHGKCLSLNRVAYIGAAFSIVEDIWILILPIPLLKSLKVARGRKLALIAMFSVGILACVTSMVRLKHMKDFGNPIDPTWDNVQGSIWSLIENAVAFICACLPALRPILSMFLPRFFGTLSDSSSKRFREGEKLEDDSENLGTLETIGHKRPTRYLDEYGLREGDLEETRRSASSVDLGRSESQKGIRMDTVLNVRSEDGETIVKGKRMP